MADNYVGKEVVQIRESLKTKKTPCFLIISKETKSDFGFAVTKKTTDVDLKKKLKISDFKNDKKYSYFEGAAKLKSKQDDKVIMDILSNEENRTIASLLPKFNKFFGGPLKFDLTFVDTVEVEGVDEDDDDSEVEDDTLTPKSLGIQKNVISANKGWSAKANEIGEELAKLLNKVNVELPSEDSLDDKVTSALGDTFFSEYNDIFANSDVLKNLAKLASTKSEKEFQELKSSLIKDLEEMSAVFEDSTLYLADTNPLLDTRISRIGSRLINSMKLVLTFGQ